MTVLCREKIWEALRRSDPAERLVVTPLLDPATQVGPASVDVRLGNEFILVRKTRLSGVGLGSRADFAQQIQNYQTRFRLGYRQELVLHPGQLLLSATLEYISVPADLMCYVIGRSSWGRLGLIIATATAVAPGYRGSPTLEIVNIGEVPLTVYPGVRIAQLVFHKSMGQGAYSGRHASATGPEFTKIHQDTDLDFWLPQG